MFEVPNEFYKIIWYKEVSLILNIITNKTDYTNKKLKSKINITNQKLKARVNEYDNID